MWRDRYLEQARSDWEAYNILRDASIARCHALHYLQMTAEKLGKAGLLALREPLDSLRTTHGTFTRFLQVTARNRNLRRELRMTGSQLQTHIRRLLPIAHDIERLAPALAGSGPNAEYPWEAPLGTINAPASYNFPVNSTLQSASGRNLLRHDLVFA